MFCDFEDPLFFILSCHTCYGSPCENRTRLVRLKVSYPANRRRSRKILVGEPGFETGNYTGLKPAAYAVLPLPPGEHGGSRTHIKRCCRPSPNQFGSHALVRIPGVEPGKHIGFEPTAYTHSAIPAWCRWWESNPQIARDLSPQHMPILLHRLNF